MTKYHIKSRNLRDKYTSFNGASRFGFDYCGSVINNELMEPQLWFVERDGLIMNALDFVVLYDSGKSESEIFSQFADFGLDN